MRRLLSRRYPRRRLSDSKVQESVELWLKESELLPSADFFVGVETTYPAVFEPDFPPDSAELEQSLGELLGKPGIADNGPAELTEYWTDPPIADVLCARP